MLPQEREELRGHEAIVPNFDGVTNAAGDADPRPGACPEFIVVFFPKVCCFTRVTRQQLEKFTQALLIQGKIWGQLPKNRAELFPKSDYARSKEVRQWHSDIAQFFHVRDETTAFDGK